MRPSLGLAQPSSLQPDRYLGLEGATEVVSVYEPSFQGILLLLLCDHLLQGKVGVDLVRILLGPKLQEQRLIDALERGHNGLLAGVLGLRCGLKIGYVCLS
jgi:hypothetical protein